jgi:SAM-dependent methyltransferase
MQQPVSRSYSLLTIEYAECEASRHRIKLSVCQRFMPHFHFDGQMNDKVRNLLYEHPEYYEVLYPESGDETPTMCRRLFESFLERPPCSILDLGCGTGRDLRSLRKTCADCVGVDFLPAMVEFAKARSNEVTFLVGDMRTVRLRRTFDAVLCFGSALMYNLTNDDVGRALDTFKVHCHTGSLLIIDMRNAAALLGDGFKPRIEGAVNSSIFTAHYVAEHSLDRKRQLLHRKRVWVMPDGSQSEDICEYRLFFPQEIEHLLSEKGFTVLGCYDNKELKETTFTGPTMYVAARLNVS